MVDQNKFFEVVQREYTNDRTRMILKRQPELAIMKFNSHNVTSLLHLAASQGNVELAKLLLNSAKGLGQIIVDIRDKDDNTPMHWAAMSGHLEVIKLLHKEGAKLALKNVVGTTPLSDAAGSGWTEIIKYLVKHNGTASLFDKNTYNLDPYARAVYSLQPEALQVIIDLAIADETTRPGLNETVGEEFNVRDIAESIALQQDKPPQVQERVRRIIKILESSGVKPSAKWQLLSTRERRDTLTIDHAGRWKQFQEEREKQAKL
jgi:ankyrin repeat protein